MNTIPRTLVLAGLLSLSVSAAPYTSAKYKFSMTPPMGWQQTNLPGFSADFFFAPENAGNVRPNIGILEPLPTEKYSPAQLCSLNAKGIPQVLANARSVRQRFDRAANICRISYIASPNGPELMFYAELRFAKSRYYVITFTAPDGAYQKLLPSVQTALKTFRAR